MKKLLFVALATLGFVACNNDLDDANNAHSGEVETSYIAINLNAVDNSTRAEGTFQDGLDAEREVKSAYFFFFDQYGNPFTVTAEAGKPATAPRGEVNWISASLTDTNDKTETKNVSDIKDAVLLLSTYAGMYPSQIVAVLNWAPTASEPYSLNDLYAATNIQGTDNAFVMSNAVYADNSDKEVVGTPLTSDYIHKNETEALAHPITIYVERIAAKVTVTAKNDVTDNRFKVEKPVTIGGSNKDVYVQVKGWSLHNDFNQSYLLKHIDPTWTDLGFTWNDAPWHRCYWATSLPFSHIASSNNFPESFPYALGSSTQVAAGTYAANTYTYIGENTNYDIENKDASNCTKVILKAELQEKVDETTYNALPLARWYATYYAGDDDLRTAVASTIQYQYYWSADENSYTKIAKEDLQVVADGNMAKFQLSTEVGATRNWYIKTGDTYTSKTKEEMNALLGGIEKAVYYKSGETLYSVDIAHLGYQLPGDQLGDYGVVRNHIYNVVINKFGGFGSPVYTPTGNLDYPDDPITAGDYVSAEVRVLSWRLVSQEVDVQP